MSPTHKTRLANAVSMKVAIVVNERYPTIFLFKYDIYESISLLEKSFGINHTQPNYCIYYHNEFI